MLKRQIIFSNRFIHFLKKSRFSTDDNNYGLDFPFKLDGLKEKINFETSNNLDQILSKAVGYDAGKAFKMAYHNVLEALVNYDTQYFEEICEPKLYSRIRESFEQLKSQGYTIECFQIGTKKTNIIVSNINFIYGVNVDRSDNFPIEHYDKQETHLKLMNLNAITYSLKTSHAHTIKNCVPFLQVEVIFGSPAKLNVIDKDDCKVNNRQSTILHKIIFENERIPDDEELKWRENLITFSGIVNALKNPYDSMLKVYIGKNYQWKIVDIDNFLSGNPHA